MGGGLSTPRVRSGVRSSTIWKPDSVAIRASSRRRDSGITAPVGFWKVGMT